MSKAADRLSALLDERDERISELEEQVAELEHKLDEDVLGWSRPRKWSAKGLPVPRLEIHWSRLSDNGSSREALYVLVYRHFTGEVIAAPMGRTKVDGGASYGFREPGKPDELATPFRDGCHARHDAGHLNLPLYVTTEDGDGTEILGRSGQDWRQVSVKVKP